MPEQFHSSEVNEIMGRAPSWVIRWGVTVLFATFAGILLGCYFIKYPETVKAPVEITTLNQPIELVARYDGLIDTIAVRNGDRIHQGDLIAVLANPASYDDVTVVEKNLEMDGEWIDRSYELGGIQSAFADFQSNTLAYRQYLATSYVQNKKRLLAEQIAKNQQYYARLREQRQIMQRDAVYEIEDVRRDSVLHARQIISESEYRGTQRSLLSRQNALKGFDATLASTELSIIQTRQQLVELSLQEQNEVAEYERRIEASRQQLLAQIASWREQFVFTAPADGIVSLLNYWSRNQHIPIGERLATIVPDGELRVIGRMRVPTTGFGRVALDQRVNVRLNGWPYMEYGVLRGRVSAISAVPLAGQTPAYVVELQFPDGLVTSYHRALPLIQKMDGEGEIITQDKRLIERFIDPIVSLFRNR